MVKWDHWNDSFYRISFIISYIHSSIHNCFSNNSFSYSEYGPEQHLLPLMEKEILINVVQITNHLTFIISVIKCSELVIQQQ